MNDKILQTHVRPSQEEITLHMILHMHKSITSTADIQNIYKISRQCSLWIRHVSKHSDCMIISGNLLAL